MIDEFLLAGFIMAVGMALAGAGTHLYQFAIGQPAALRYDGKTVLHMFGHLIVSFLCGPYIMLQMGWSQDKGQDKSKDGTLSISTALVAAFVAFGWAFVTGLLALGGYIAIIG